MHATLPLLRQTDFRLCIAGRWKSSRSIWVIAAIKAVCTVMSMRPHRKESMNWEIVQQVIELLRASKVHTLDLTAVRRNSIPISAIWSKPPAIAMCGSSTAAI